MGLTGGVSCGYHLCRRSMGVRAALRAAWRANGYNEPGAKAAPLVPPVRGDGFKLVSRL